jgi:serine/threonine protein kinase
MMGATDWQSAGARIGDYVTERNLAAKPGFVACSAKHALLPRRARISTVHPAFAGSQAIAAQLVREACILEVLRHAGVPRVFECGELDDGRPWVACELVEGPSLALLLAEEGKLEVSMVLALLAGVAEILHYAHTRGLVHRNLRPEAIASRPEGPCIVDWSDARARESEALQLAPLDWLAYQPPEVIGGEPADSRADVFALGVIAYEALAGAKPSGTGATARRFPAVPIRLLALIDRMLAPDALVRPTSAEVRAEALAIVEQIEVPVPPPADEDGPDVQIVDVELESELADADLDGWGAPPPPPPLLPDGSQAFPPLDDRARTKTMPPVPEIDHVRTKTEPMLAEHLLSRTKTEPMTSSELEQRPPRRPAAEPEPRVPRTATRVGKVALPPRIIEKSRTKTH